MPAEEFRPNRAASHRPTTTLQMIHNKKALLGRVYTVVSVLCATAQADEATVQLAPITVSAHDGMEIPYDSTGVSVTVVDVEQMKKEGIYGVAEALTTVPGVNIQPGGGENQRGNVANTAIRGINKDTAVIPMIDGMRIFNSGGGGLLTANTMARTDLFSIGTLEVLKGSQGASYGSGAMGGVVYMETPQGDSTKPQLSLFNEAGSFNSYTGNITAQGQKAALSYFLSSTYTRTDNDLRFADGSRPTARNAGEAESQTTALRLDWQLNQDNQLTLTYRREDSEYGYVSSWQGNHFYTPYDFRNNLITLKHFCRINEKWSSSLMAGYYGYDATLGTGYYQELRNVQLEWRNAIKWCAHQTTTAGFAWNRSAYDYFDNFSINNGDRNLENTYSLFAEHTYTPIKNWSNSLAARLEFSNIYSASMALRAASSYRFNKDATRLFTSMGSGYRSPGSFQRSNGCFTSGYYTYHGNPHLKQEKSYSIDAGVEHDILPGHSINLTAFWQRLNDAINTDYRDYSDVYYSNDSGHWTIIGTELSLQGELEANWNTGYRLSWTHIRPKTSNKHQIPWTSRNSWSAEFYTSPIDGLTTGLNLIAAAGRTNYDAAATRRLDNYYSLRWYVQYKATENLTLHLRIENLTNQQFVTEGGFGAPGDAIISAGRSVHGGITLKF